MEKDTENVEKFSQTHDLKYFDALSNETKKLFIKEAKRIENLIGHPTSITAMIIQHDIDSTALGRIALRRRRGSHMRRPAAPSAAGGALPFGAGHPSQRGRSPLPLWLRSRQNERNQLTELEEKMSLLNMTGQLNEQKQQLIEQKNKLIELEEKMALLNVTTPSGAGIPPPIAEKRKPNTLRKRRSLRKKEKILHLRNRKKKSERSMLSSSFFRSRRVLDRRNPFGKKE
jgi:hypothetical protein